MDWVGFKKLFKVPVPVLRYADYYVEVLSKSPEYCDLPDLIIGFKEFESRHPEGIKRYKEETLERLIAVLRQTDAFESFSNYEYRPIEAGFPDLRGQYGGGEWLVSLDLVSANFNTFRSFGLEFEDWRAFCTTYGVDPFLVRSKSFRQIVFGNLNPRRNQRIQAETIEEFRSLVYYLAEDKDIQMVHISSDEFVVASPDLDQRELFELLEQVTRWTRLKSERKSRMPVRLQLQRRYKLEGKGQYLVEYYDFRSPTYGRYPTYKSLLGVPGNRFFPLFKKLIVEQPLDDLDFMFTVDDDVAMWCDRA